MNAKKKVICVGELLIDFLPGNEEGSYLRKPGGAPANVAVALSKLGLSSYMCCKVGDDDFGHFLMDTLDNYGVSHDANPYTDKAVTTMAFITLKDGERSITFSRKPGADTFMSKADVDNAGIRDALLVHAGSCTLSAGEAAEATLYAIKKAHEAGCLVSFDVNYRNLMWNDDYEACGKTVRGILPYIDLLKISDEEAYVLGGEEALPKLMKEYNISVLVETLGAKGARCFFRDKVFEVPGKNIKPVDTTGAGDAFWSGFLFTLLNDNITCCDEITESLMEKALNVGNMCGALCCTKKGAMESLPSMQEIIPTQTRFR